MSLEINNNNIIKLEWFEESDQKDLSNYLCKICNGVYNNPVLLSCGHILCKQCYDINKNKCSICNEMNISIQSENPRFLTLYLSKKMCTCKNAQCKKKFNIENILSHLKECPKELLMCQYNCGNKILRENLSVHEKECMYRPCTCTLCGKDVLKFKYLENHLEKECDKNFIKCQFCEENILKKNIESHLNFNCTKSDKKCMFSIIGCEEKIAPNGNEQHLEMFKLKHIELLAQFLMEINNKTLNIYRKINWVEKKNKKSLNKLKNKWEIKQKQMTNINLNNIENDNSYSIALDEELGEGNNGKDNK